MTSLGAKFSFDNQVLQENQLKNWPHLHFVASNGVDIHAIKQTAEEKTHVFSDKDESPVQIIKEESDWSDVFDDETVKSKSKECLWKHGISENKGGIHVNKQKSEERMHKYESFQANQFMEEETGPSQVVDGETVVKLRADGLQNYRNDRSKEVVNLVIKQRWEEKTKSAEAYLGLTGKQEDNLRDHHIREKEHDRHSDTDIMFPYDGMLYTEQMTKHDKSSNMLILIIKFITSYVRSAFQLFLSSVLVCYHCIFSLNMNFDSPKVKINGVEKKNSKVYNEKANSGLDKISLVKPKTVTRGVKNIAFGFVTAIYVVIILSILFITAFMFSFLVVKSLIYEPVNLKKELYFDYTKDRPVASITFEESKMYSTTETILRRVSLPARRFHATVILTLPESDFNKKLGIFQVTAELLSVTGQVLMIGSQPCMLHFRSTLLQYTRSILMSIPVLTGICSETQTLALSILEWQEERHFQSEGIKLLLAPRAGFTLGRGLPEMYKAEIYVKSEIPWWFSFMGWRWTFCVWIALIIFLGEVVLILGLFRCLLLPDFASFYTSCIKTINGKQKSSVK